VPLDEALVLVPSICVSVGAPFSTEPLAVVDDPSPCEPATNSGVCDSIMAVCDSEVLASLAVVLPAVFGEASLPASLGLGLPAEPNEASFCVPADESGVCGLTTAVGDVGFPACWSPAGLEAVAYESGDPWLCSGSMSEAAVGAGVV
jgi:hypothetical protein